jgi:hypothetical protein
MSPTADDFLNHVRSAILESQEWAGRNPPMLDDFMARMREGLRGKRTSFIHDSPSMVKAWRACGFKGRPTWKVLFSLPWRDEAVARYVSEGLGECQDFCPSDNG